MNGENQWGLLSLLKKTVVFIVLAIVIVFIGVGIEISIYKHVWGIAIPRFHVWSPLSMDMVFAVLIPVVYMGGVRTKKRAVIFLKGTVTLIAVYFSYHYLIQSISVVVKPDLFSPPFRTLFFLMSLKGLVAVVAGLYVSIKSMRFERQIESFTSYPFAMDSPSKQEETPANTAEPTPLPVPFSQGKEITEKRSSVENIQESVIFPTQDSPAYAEDITKNEKPGKARQVVVNLLFSIVNGSAAFFSYSMYSNSRYGGFETLLVASAFFCLTAIFLLWPGRNKDIWALWIRRRCAEENKRILDMGGEPNRA